MKRLNLFLFLIALFFINNTLLSQTSYSLLQEGKKLRSEGKDRKAVNKLEEALNKAKAERNMEVQMSAHIELAELKDNVINYKEALNHYKEFSLLYKKQVAQKTKMLEDSVTGLKTVVDSGKSEIAKKETEIKKKESEIDSLTTEQLKSQLAIKDLEIENNQKELKLKTEENRRNLLFFVLIVIVLAAVFVIRGYVLKRRGMRLLSQKNRQIIMEKQKSEDLLLNILPVAIADELKEHGKTTPCKHDYATVMFTDFVGFTSFSEKHSPEEIVKMVDHYFREFDKIVKKYHIEKIKTIGDAYMCVSGIPEFNENHAETMIRAAFEFRDFVNSEAEENRSKNLPFLRMRIGLHSGPLVAGVVGSKKFAYDVWGDTVNIAARMEQAGEPGSINVSETVYEPNKNKFHFEFRGEIDAKNKGKMKMYFVSEEVKS